MEQTPCLTMDLFSIEKGTFHESRHLPNSKPNLALQPQPRTRKVRWKL